jgi:tripartite-type tricarboxylate transporter receptor subunit TctC
LRGASCLRSQIGLRAAMPANIVQKGNAVKLSRRKFGHFAAGVVGLPAASRLAWADVYPNRPVRLVVSFPAGYAPDIVARLVGEPLSGRLGQPVVIENRPGAGSNIGTEVVVRAPGDGHTLLVAVAGNTMNATLYGDLKFNFVRDIAPVASICGTPFVMIINPSVPAKTVPELIAYAKANPGRLNMATPGVGTAPHVFGEMFKMMTGVNLAHVPYRSSFVPDLLGGQVQVAFMTVILSAPYVRDGKLRALAITTATPSELLPGIPVMGEFVPGYDANGWVGVGAPRSTPGEIIERLNKEINAVVVDPNMSARLIGLGSQPMSMTAAQFGKLIADETDKWAKVIKFANIKAG